MTVMIKNYRYLKSFKWQKCLNFFCYCWVVLFQYPGEPRATPGPLLLPTPCQASRSSNLFNTQLKPKMYGGEN